MQTDKADERNQTETCMRGIGPKDHVIIRCETFDVLSAKETNENEFEMILKKRKTNGILK